MTNKDLKPLISKYLELYLNNENSHNFLNTMETKGISLNREKYRTETKTKKNPTPRPRVRVKVIQNQSFITKTKKNPAPRPKIRVKVIPNQSFISRVFSTVNRTPNKALNSRKKASRKVGNFMLKHRNQIHSTFLTKKRASRKVGNFMLKHRNKIRLTFLNTICSNSNLCIGFGKETKTIRKFFDDFDFNSNETTLKYRAIGMSNMNKNFNVLLFTFTKHGYEANAVFKTPRDVTCDNLAYEAMVGKFLNKQKLRFPCFLETYGLYFNYNRKEEAYYIKRPRDYKKIDINKEGLIKSCNDPLFVGLMIENINEAYTLDREITDRFLMFTKREIYLSFMNHELLYILYQIYAPLSILSDSFTHYDLNTNNVRLYIPEPKKHIEYHYHYPDRVVKFNSKYIVKIIDYGRSYFKDDSGYNPSDIYKDLCENCSDCGKNSGFDWLEPNTKTDYNSPQKRNMSADLKLFISLQSYIKCYNDDIVELITSVEYKEKYGTPEITTKNDKKICNVNDALRHIEKLMNKMYFKKGNDLPLINKIGEMHIYSDGKPMIYIPTNRTNISKPKGTSLNTIPVEPKGTSLNTIPVKPMPNEPTKGSLNSEDLSIEEKRIMKKFFKTETPEKTKKNPTPRPRQRVKSEIVKEDKVDEPLNTIEENTIEEKKNMSKLLKPERRVSLRILMKKILNPENPEKTQTQTKKNPTPRQREKK